MYTAAASAVVKNKVHCLMQQGHALAYLKYVTIANTHVTV